jgi:GTP-binding protein
VENTNTIANELEKYDEDLMNKERWLVLNKVDLLPPETRDQQCKELVKRLGWTGRVFIVSGLAKQGLEDLANQAMNYLEEESDLEL